MVRSSSGGGVVIWELSEREIDDEMFIESIEPIDERRLLVGVCCEPPEGRQRIVDLETATPELLPVDSRFPHVAPGGTTLVSGGFDVRIEALGALLAYESGVGVVVPGPILREGDGTFLYRPVALTAERVVFIDGESGPIVISDPSGDVSHTIELEGAVSVDFDAMNDTVVVLVNDQGASGAAGNTIQFLSADALSPVAQWSLEEPVTSIDVKDGWLLLSDSDGSLRARTLDDVDAPAVSLIDDTTSAASWLR